MELPIVVGVLALIPCWISAVEDHNASYDDFIQESFGFQLNKASLGNSESLSNKSETYSAHENTNNDDKSRRNSNDNSPWCAVAAKCNKSYVPVCGFDDNFGLARFNDICHLFEVNCYWNYNFSVAPCRRIKS